MLDGDMLTVESIENNLNSKLVGVVPEDDIVSTKMFSGRRYIGDSQSEISFNMIAKVLTSDRQIIYDVTQKYRGLFGSIRKKLKRRL